ncbi:MAG: sigma-70 family RNA polymerase sigma factor [Planctomycetota bacterium]|nr:sigma-70 family RNA polymerase sigma factor [Planctomycetota bacterium]
MDISERQLIERFRLGDHAAFEEIVQQWNRDMTNLAYRMTGHLEEAQDIAQQCFLKAFQARSTFEGQASLGTWLYRITLNLCRDRIRSDQSRRRVLDAMTQTRPRRTHSRPTDTASGGESKVRIAEAVGGLPDKEREVVVLRHYHHLSCREIAEMLDTPYTTIKSRLAQGLEKLRLTLRDLNPCSA